MIGQGYLCALVASTLFCALPFWHESKEPQDTQEIETHETLVDAYIYGYPLVTMEMTKRVMTNVALPEAMKAPVGQFAHERSFRDASSKDLKAPSLDTLTSLAWIDVGAEPYILSLPDLQGRFNIFSFFSGWTEVFADPGIRTREASSGLFAITGPGWEGVLPTGVIELKSPTGLVWIVAKLYCSGTSDDMREVRLLQDRFLLIPLSRFGQRVELYKARVDPAIVMTTPVVDQVKNMDGMTYFKMLTQLLLNNPPAPIDSRIIEKMTKIGLIPGAKIDTTTIDRKTIALLDEAPELALEKITLNTSELGKKTNGWTFYLDSASFAGQYLNRASFCEKYLGACLAKDELVITTNCDKDSKPLNGDYSYLLHLSKEMLPPISRFWSLTLYDQELFLVKNPIHRNAIGSKDTLKYNNDGSLDIYIQKSSPGKDKESNWLAVPRGNFTLMFRLYAPKEAALDGTWLPPTPEREKGWLF